MAGQILSPTPQRGPGRSPAAAVGRLLGHAARRRRASTFPASRSAPRRTAKRSCCDPVATLRPPRDLGVRVASGGATGQYGALWLERQERLR